MNRRLVMGALLLAALAPLPVGAASPLPDRVLGKADAPVTIIEYASLTCDHCKRFHIEILPKVKTTYLDTGKARLLFRHFPLNQPALLGAIVTECVPREQVFGLIDVLFRMEETWGHSRDPKGELQKIARLAGIPDDRLQACFADNALSDSIVLERQRGETEHKVNSTPTLITGTTMLRGVRNFEEVAKAIDVALARQ